MRNLHSISKPLTELDYAVLWYHGRYHKVRIRANGLIEINDVYYTADPWQPIHLTPNDEEYILEIWRKSGSPIVKDITYV